MRQIIKYTVLLIMFFSVPLMATGPRVTQSLISPDKKEIFAVDLPPFISTEVEAGGALKEIVVSAFEEVGVDMIVTILPLRSMAKYYLTQENAIGIMGRHMGISPDEKGSLIEIPLYVAQENYFYYKPSHENALEWNGKLSNLKGLTYGASKGEEVSVYKDAGIKIKKARTLSLFKKLQSSKVDFISLPKESASWFIEKKFKEHLNDFVMMKKSSTTASISLYFNSKHPKGQESSKAFKKGLHKLVKSGAYANILGKYIDNKDKVNSQVKRINKYLK